MITLNGFKKDNCTLKDFNLKGKIKAISQKQIFVDKNQKQILESEKYWKSQITLELEFSINGSLTNKTETNTTLKNYNSNTYKSTFRYEYNESNQLIKYHDRYACLQFVYRGDKLIEVNNINKTHKTNQVTHKFEFEYDYDGRLKSVTRDDRKLKQGNSHYEQTTYDYLNDKLLRVRRCNRHHKTVSYKDYEYNSNNSPIKITNVGAFNSRNYDFFEYNSNNDLILKNCFYYEYEYDNYGNWIKRYEYEKFYGLYLLLKFRRKSLVSITTRQIEYLKQK